MLRWKFPLLIKFCSSSHLPLQCSDCQLIQLSVSRWFFWWKSNVLDERAAQQTLLYPHLHAPKQTDIGRTATCWGEQLFDYNWKWPRIECSLCLYSNKTVQGAQHLMDRPCSVSQDIHSFLGSLCSQVCHKPQDMVTACKLCDTQTLNSHLTQNFQLHICFHLCHTYYRCFTVIYLEGYEQLQEQRYKLSSKGQIKADAILPKVCYFFLICF